MDVAPNNRDAPAPDLPPDVPPGTPLVIITAPTNGKAVYLGADLDLTVTATDDNGTVTKVEILADGNLLATLDQAPYVHKWPMPAAGTYTLQARATDDMGVVGQSIPVKASVLDLVPVTMTSPAVWWRGDQGVMTAADRVNRWVDQSGGGNDATQANQAAMPQLRPDLANGFPAVWFDGMDDILSFTLPVNGFGTMTLMLVSVNRTDSTGGGAQEDNPALFWDETGLWGKVYVSPFQSRVLARFGSGESGNYLSHMRPASIAQSATLTGVAKNGDSESVFVNGTRALMVAGKRPSIDRCEDAAALGGRDGSHFAGHIAEVLIYKRALPDDERMRVETYLRAKYFLP